MNNLPPSLDARALAKLLAPLVYKSESTILKDINRRPWTLPPSVMRAGKKIWLKPAVLEWWTGEKAVIYPPELQSLGAALMSASQREHHEP